MQRQQLVDEIKVLMDLVADKTTTLADSVMEIDVNEYTDPKQFEREKIELFRHYPQFVGPSCVVTECGRLLSPLTTPASRYLIVRQQDGEPQSLREYLLTPRRSIERVRTWNG